MFLLECDVFVLVQGTACSVERLEEELPWGATSKLKDSNV